MAVLDTGVTRQHEDLQSRINPYGVNIDHVEMLRPDGTKYWPLKVTFGDPGHPGTPGGGEPDREPDAANSILAHGTAVAGVLGASSKISRELLERPGQG